MEDDNFADDDGSTRSERARNILTLEERVLAIQTYDCKPLYGEVAKMFNCSKDQIKSIIADREAIMTFYEATKKSKQKTDPNQNDIRRQKINFLGECMYEYIQRSQFHKKALVTEEFIRRKALEFRDIMGIEHFMPNKVWLNQFKNTYNFSLSNRQVTLTRMPSSSLDVKDIMIYCTNNKSKVANGSAIQPKIKNLYRTTTKLSVSQANDDAFNKIVQKRNREIDFLEIALSEYIRRFEYHRKTPLRDAALLKVTSELTAILKIHKFIPNQTWLYTFKIKQNSLSQRVDKPLLSLDLNDIVNYCRREESNNDRVCLNGLTAWEKDLNSSAPVLAPFCATTTTSKKFKINNRICFNDLSSYNRKQRGAERATSSSQSSSVNADINPSKKNNMNVRICLKDLSPSVEKRRSSKRRATSAPKIDVATSKKPRIFSTIEDSDLSDDTCLKEEFIDLNDSDGEINIKPMIIEMEEELQQEQEVNIEVILPNNAKTHHATPANGDDSELDIKPIIIELQEALKQGPQANKIQHQVPSNEDESEVDIKPMIIELEEEMQQEQHINTEVILPNIVKANQSDPLSKDDNSEIDIKPIIIELEEELEQEPEMCTERSVPSPEPCTEFNDKDIEELPSQVKTYDDALKLLKPLEEFAMLQQNFRVIGLLSQVEEIFKLKKSNEQYEGD